MAGAWSWVGAVRVFSWGCGAGVVGTLTFFNKVGYFARVDGKSMQPSLNPDTLEKPCPDIVFLNRWAVKDFVIQRGDVVSMISPREPDEIIIKRVIAVEGDTIRSAKGNISIQCSPQALEASWYRDAWDFPRDASRTLKYKNRYVKVPTGHIWIEGDHAEVSLDSNIFGPVSLGLLHAKASRIVWPPHRQQKLKSFVPSNRQPVNSKTQNFEQFILDDDEELALSTL